jgi:hypothetical protein
MLNSLGYRYHVSREPPSSILISWKMKTVSCFGTVMPVYQDTCHHMSLMTIPAQDIWMKHNQQEGSCKLAEQHIPHIAIISGTFADIWPKSNFGPTGHHHPRSGPLPCICIVPSICAIFKYILEVVFCVCSAQPAILTRSSSLCQNGGILVNTGVLSEQRGKGNTVYEEYSCSVRSAVFSVIGRKHTLILSCAHLLIWYGEHLTNYNGE